MVVLRMTWGSWLWGLDDQSRVIDIVGPGDVAVTHANGTFDDTAEGVVVVADQVHGLLYSGLGEVVVDDGNDQCWLLNLAVGLVLHLDQF